MCFAKTRKSQNWIILDTFAWRKVVKRYKRISSQYIAVNWSTWTPYKIVVSLERGDAFYFISYRVHLNFLDPNYLFKTADRIENEVFGDSKNLILLNIATSWYPVLFRWNRRIMKSKLNSNFIQLPSKWIFMVDEHLCVGRMTERMQGQYYKLLMAGGLYTTVRDCYYCAQNKPSNSHRHWLLLFPESGPLELFAMVNLQPRPEHNERTQLLLVRKNLYQKWRKAVPTFKSTALPIVSLFINTGTITYVIPPIFLTSKKMQFVSKLVGIATQLFSNEIVEGYGESQACQRTGGTISWKDKRQTTKLLFIA